MDLITPIGMGQRGLIVAPPGAGKTTLLKHICQAVVAAYPEIKLYALLIDERPEEVTDFKRSVTAEVYASSSDESYARHVRVADNLLQTARRQAGQVQQPARCGHQNVHAFDQTLLLGRGIHTAIRGHRGELGMPGVLRHAGVDLYRQLASGHQNQRTNAFTA